MCAPLNPYSFDFGDICALYSPFLSLTGVSVVVCGTRKLRPCLSYSWCRDHNNLGLLRSLSQRGTMTCCVMHTSLASKWSGVCSSLQRGQKSAKVGASLRLQAALDLLRFGQGGGCGLVLRFVPFPSHCWGPGHLLNVWLVCAGEAPFLTPTCRGCTRTV